MIPLAISEQSRNFTRSPLRGRRVGLCGCTVQFRLMMCFIPIGARFACVLAAIPPGRMVQPWCIVVRGRHDAYGQKYLRSAIVQLMEDECIKRLPVVQDGKLAGIVSRTDLFLRYSERVR